MPSADKLVELPEDSGELKAILRSLLLKQDAEKRRAEKQQRRADALHIENLRLRVKRRMGRRHLANFEPRSYHRISVLYRLYRHCTIVDYSVDDPRMRL